MNSSLLQRFLSFNRVRNTHLTVGITVLIVFLATGQYMHWGYDHLKGMEDAPRMLFRSAHIYLLWSGLLNTALGLYLQPCEKIWSQTLQRLGSLAILVGPPLLLSAFLLEPWLSQLVRPYARPAIYSAFGGILAHFIATVGERYS